MKYEGNDRRRQILYWIEHYESMLNTYHYPADETELIYQTILQLHIELESLIIFGLNEQRPIHSRAS